MRTARKTKTLRSRGVKENIFKRLRLKLKPESKPFVRI
jgi:hypothetical protein